MENKVVCNSCGKELKMINGMMMEDAFEARKRWGYFSKKDTVEHAFVLCEECYDRIVSEFKIPVRVYEVTEL